MKILKHEKDLYVSEAEVKSWLKKNYIKWANGE